MKAKALIPSPDKYAHQRKDFFDTMKHSKIYCHDKKAMMDYIIADSKKVPGVGKYQNWEYDEKRCRPPRGISKVTVEKITTADEMINIG